MVLHAGPSTCFNGEQLFPIVSRGAGSISQKVFPHTGSRRPHWERREKKEPRLLRVLDKEAIIKTTVRASWPFGARMKSHYVHDGGRVVFVWPCEKFSAQIFSVLCQRLDVSWNPVALAGFKSVSQYSLCISEGQAEPAHIISLSSWKFKGISENIK